MYKRINLLLLSLVVITSQCFAGDVTFGEAKTAVSGADAQQLKVNDLDGDSKPDLIWRDSSGNLKYSLQASATNQETVLQPDPEEGMDIFLRSSTSTQVWNTWFLATGGWGARLSHKKPT
ncbi:hypothetical protein WDW89_19190 [Deltaproteobacteria bacterium TL4]